MASTEPKIIPLTRRPAGDWRDPSANELEQEHCAKSWAWRLRGRELAGDDLSHVQRKYWREALELELA